MTIEAKEVVIYIGKCVLFSFKTSYRSARGHPYISGVVFVLLILYNVFPTLFAFLVYSFPVIVCTAILLGTLLSYGTPNISNIERENKQTHDVSSLQVRSVIDDLVLKKDEGLTVESFEQTSSEVDEETPNEEALSEATSASGTMHDEGVYKDLPASYFVNENMEETQSEKKFTEEREACKPALVEMGEFAGEKQPEVALGLDEDVAYVSVADQEEGEGLTVHISKPTPDNLFYSSLGSPWEPIVSHDASSSSDSDSGESSSPDASMADIIPMLDELHPLLDSEHPQATLSATGYSEAASSESSEDEDSDDGSAEAEVKNNEDEGKEEVQEEKHESNEDAVTWNADDQKSVMDLGVSELERNRRLESLIAKRRARKLQRFETEKNLIDLDSYYPTAIPSISAPRRNPFDLSYDPFPSSAPSVLQPRQNPFDIPYEQVEKYGILSREYLNHYDFGSGEDISKRRHGISTLGTSFSNYSHQEKDNSKWKPYLFAERMDSEESEFTAFQRQLSAMGDSKSSYVSEFEKASSVTGQENCKPELLEPQEHQKSNFSADELDAHHGKQDNQYFEEVDSVDVKHTQRRVDLGDDRVMNLNTLIVGEGTCQQTDSFSAVEEVDEAPANFPHSDIEKLVDTEGRYEESDSSSEESVKSSDLGFHEGSDNLEHTRNDSMQSDDIEDANPVYDSSPSTVGKTLSDTSILDESLLTEGKEDFISSSLPSDVQADFSEVASPQKPLEMDPSYEDRDYMDASRSVGEELASGSGGHYIASTIVSSQDEIESKSRERTEIKEYDDILVEMSKASEDATELAAGEIVPSLSLFTVNSKSGEGCPNVMDKITQSEGNNIMDEPPSMKESAVLQPSEAEHEDSQVRKLELPSLPEENLVDSKFEEEHESIIEPFVVSCTTGLQVIKEHDLCLYDTKHEPSSCLKSAEDIGDYIDTKLVHKEENNDAPVLSSSIPSHDGHATGMHFLEPRESTEFSVLSSKTTAEIEMDSNNALGHSGGNIIDEVQSKEEPCLEYLNHSDEESDAEIYAGATEIEEIDEGLLAELDAVGDFWVDKEPKPDQGDSDEESQFQSHFDSVKVSSAEMQDSPSQVQYSEARPTYDVNTSLSLLSEDTSGISDKVNPIEDRTTLLQYEVLPSSVMASCENPEMTVYNSKLHVLESCSLEELDSVFKQLGEKAVEPSSDLTFDSLETSNSGVKASGLDVVDREPEQSEVNPQLLVQEAKSGEDITLALKQVEPSEDLPVGTHSEPAETNAELEILEAKSLEDIDLALKQLSEGIKNLNPPSLMEHKDGFTEAETSQSHHESERNLEPELNEVKYCEQMDSKEDVVEETDMAVEKVDDQSDGIIVMPAVSDSIASESGKSRKKGKSIKSDSSSSSSSSDSD